MNRRGILMLIVLMLVWGVGVRAQTRSVGELLLQGMYAEKTEGDLDKAIGLYEQILERAETSEIIQASATYHLGLCYLKKGEKEAAAEYFQKAVQTYPEQTALVINAQRQLNKLSSVRERTEPSGEFELALDDGKQAGKWSYSGGGHAVRFKAPGNDYILKAIRLYGSRYGDYSPPEENFSVWLCGSDFSIIKEFQFPYATFKTRGMAKWAQLEVEPTQLPEEFILCVGFDPHRTKGIYLYHDAKAGGSSFTGLPGSDLNPFSDGDWLFRAVIENAQATNPIPIITDSFEEGEELPQGWQQGRAVPGVTYRWDQEVAYQGQSSLCLEKTANSYFPIAQWTRRIEHNGKDTRLAVDVQVRALEATKAIVDALFLDSEDNWIRHEWVSYIGDKSGSRAMTHPWKSYRGQVSIPENTHSIVIGLQIYGPGTVWFDDLRVAYVQKGNKAPGIQDRRAAEDLIAEGWDLWRKRKLAEAEDVFDEATRIDPNNDGGFQGLGWSQFNQGKRLQAQASFEACIALNPQNSAALNGLGWIAHAQDQLDEAIAWWEKAVQASHGNATASLSGLTRVYMERKEFDAAVKYYKMWLKVDPENEQARAGLADAQKALQAQ